MVPFTMFCSSIILQSAMSDQVPPHYQYDTYRAQYYLKDSYVVVRRRMRLVESLKAAGTAHNVAWREAFKQIPHTYQDPATGLPYPEEQ